MNYGINWLHLNNSERQAKKGTVLTVGTQVHKCIKVKFCRRRNKVAKNELKKNTIT
jgi:hypothetical protein